MNAQVARQITLEHVDDLARGAALLGTGGGGDPYIGSLMLRQVLQDGCRVELIDVEAVGDDDFMVPFALMGAPTVLVEKIPNGVEMERALQLMEQQTGERAKALMCAEIGGGNALLPLVLGGRLGLPVVDGDGMGRAFPGLHMLTYNVFGIPCAPLTMTDEFGTTAILRSDSAEELERIGRNIVVAMGGSCAICFYPMHGRDARRALVRGTLTLALGLGRTIREARRSSGDPFAQLAAYLRNTSYYKHCRVLFEGKVVDVLRNTVGGYVRGVVMIAGTGSCLGRQISIEYQNEHLVAREGPRVLAIVPDLIAVLDSATAEPITTEGLKYGQRVAVLGISAAPIMRTPESLAIFGPQVFG
ncbi:MAG TPA: DUF917 domain-containing protein, partial [Burkholderiales bacterium]|nr:DUF917 domain-containing protein [Burkholderiales bacterium]